MLRRDPCNALQIVVQLVLNESGKTGGAGIRLNALEQVLQNAVTGDLTMHGREFGISPEFIEEHEDRAVRLGFSTVFTGRYRDHVAY